MTVRISEKHDATVLAMVSGTGLSAAGKDTLLQNIKTLLDANYASFKNGDGSYTVPHVRAAYTQVVSRGK